MVNDRQSLDLTTFALASGGGEVEWRISAGPVPYPEAVAEMESRAADIADRKAAERVWLLEHPPLYTSGTSGKASDLLDPRDRKSTRLNSSHSELSRMPSSA